MRRSIFSLVCLLMGSGLGPAALGVAPEPSHATYRAIPERNVFGLKPIEQQIINTQAPPQLPKLVLEGITTILDSKRALLKVEPTPGKPTTKPPTELSLILTEGQREGDIEVLQIDEKAGSVKVNNSGTVMLLTFDKDGPKVANSPAPSGPAARPFPGLTPPPLPGSVPAGSAPQFQFRLPGNPAGAPAAAGAATSPAGTSSGSASAVSNGTAGTQTEADDLTVEEQQIVAKLRQEAMAQGETDAAGNPTPSGLPQPQTATPRRLTRPGSPPIQPQ